MSSAKSKFIPEPVSVWLGQDDQVVEYKVVPASWASLTLLKGVFRELIAEVTALWNTDLTVPGQSVGDLTIKELVDNPKVWELVDSLLAKPQQIFELAIPGLNANLFSPDNPKGITTVQVIATFEIIFQVNRLEVAKKMLGGLMTTNSTLTG